MNDQKPQDSAVPMSAASGLSAMFGFTVGQEVTVTRKLWEPPDDYHPGCLLAIPGDRLIVRSFGGSQQHPISVSHHDRTDGMTFFASPDELKPNAIGQAADAALSRQVACTDGLGVAVPPAPTFNGDRKDEH